MRNGRHNSIWKLSRGAQRPGLKCVPGQENGKERPDGGLPRWGENAGAWAESLRPYIREAAALVGFTSNTEGPVPALLPAPTPTAPPEDNLTTSLDKITEKGGGHMNKLQFDRKIHISRLLNGVSRRVVAFALAAGMCVPWFLDLGSAARALSLPIWPLQADHTVAGVNDTESISDSSDFPDVEIESNFVRDEFGFLTGYMELGLRVKTPVDQNGDPKAFQALEVTLEYDTDFLTPVDWTLESNELVLGVNRPDGTPHPDADPIHRYGYFTEQLPTQKMAEISDGTAHSGWPDTAIAGVTAGVADNSRAMLSIEARSAVSADNKKVYFAEMTTIAVIRFKVNEEQMENITITKNGKDALGKDIYVVCYDGNQVDNIAQLQKEMTDFAASASGGTTIPGGGTATPPAPTAAVEEVVRFANDKDMDLSGSAGLHHAGMALHYQGGAEVKTIDGEDEVYKVEYYYTDVPLLATPVTEEYEGTSYTLNKPDTSDDTIPILAVNPDLAAGAPGKYSYLTNLIFNDLVDPADPLGERTHINFTVTSKRSFMDTKDLLGNVTIITLLDWDNSTIGQLVVPKRKDVRGLVSDYVAENLIYHDTDDSAVGDNDINDPAAAALRDGVTELDVVSSLDRIYNYRGKYPADAPAVDFTYNATTVDDKDLLPDGTKDPTSQLPYGKTYPLTNKLDYVFLKRPMTHPDPAPDPKDPKYDAPGDPDHSGANHPDYIADLEQWNASDDWIQVADNTAAGGGSSSGGVSAFYDLEHPYAYGWALCTQENYEDVWTTLGSEGELISYEVDSDGRGKVTYDGTADFRFADLEKGFTVDRVYLKAVYEPGTELMSSDIFYRMIKAPYYNKLNYGAAKAGGAYSADVTFERATTDEKVGDTGNKVRGVTRLRQPYARQDVTTDLKWEEDAGLGVNHDLPNANLTSAYDSKDKTTFIKIDVTNTEEISFSLTLSARQNKVDYYIIEAYNTNFVAGGAHTDNDNSRSETVAILDNYNYLVDGESNITDDWHDPVYKDREGSRGFVLFGTLNQIMEQATRCYNGEMDLTGFMSYASLDVFVDMNLKKSDGTAPGLLESMPMAQKIVDAAGAAQAAHLAGDDTYWNVERNCAQLTYHQLQGYIIDSSLAHSESPVAGLFWCHLHAACAGVTSKPIKTWQDLMDAVADYVYTPNTSALDQLTDTFHLRKGITAEPFANRNDMKTALIAAVTALKNNGVTDTEVKALTWTQVQFFLDEGVAATVTTGAIPSDTDITDPSGVYKKDYWWTSTGAGKKTISTWQELLEIYYHIANDGYFEGDSTTSGWWSEYTLNDKLTGNIRDKDANGDWLAPGTPYTTKDVALRKDDAGKPFDTMAQFQAALDKALPHLDGAYPNGEFDDVSLMEIQHALLDKGYETEPDLMGDGSAPVSPAVNYWWITGAKAPTTLKELVELVDGVNEGTTPDEMLDVITAETMAKAPFWLRVGPGLDGNPFPSDADLRTALKTQVAAWKVRLGGSFPSTMVWPNAGPKDDPGCNWSDPAARQTWSQLQNLLLGNAWSNNPDPGPTSFDFWWYGDGHQPITDLKQLMEAAWNTWGGPGGTAPSDSTDPGAMDGLTDLEFITGLEQTDPPSVDITKYLYFRKNEDGDPFDSVDDFKAALKEAIQKITNRNPTKDFAAGQDWIVIQHLLLGNNYRTASNLRGDPDIDYWWENGGSKPTVTVDYTWANGVVKELTRALSEVLLNDDNCEVSVDAASALLTDTMVRALNLCNSSGTPLDRTQLANQLVNAIQGHYNAFLGLDSATGDPYPDGWDGRHNGNDELEVSWAELQYYILTGTRDEKTPGEISGICTWTPANDITGGIDYTAANAWTKAVTKAASNILLNSDNVEVTVADVEPLITEQAAKDLDLRDGGTTMDKSALATKIVDVVSDFYNNYYFNDGGSGLDPWDNSTFVDDSTAELSLDWSSLQYWITTGTRAALNTKTYEEMKDNYSIDWYPINDPEMPSTYSLRRPAMLKAPAEEKTEETTEVVTSEDGLQTVTVTTRTTTNPATGITTIVKTEQTVLDLGDRLVKTTNVTTLTVNTRTGEVDSHTKYGTPEITLKAEMVEPVEPDEPTGPAAPDEPGKPTTPEDSYRVDPDTVLVIPDEGTRPDGKDDGNKDGNGGAGVSAGPADGVDDEKAGTGEGEGPGSTAGTPPTGEDVDQKRADEDIGPYRTDGETEVDASVDAVGSDDPGGPAGEGAGGDNGTGQTDPPAPPNSKEKEDAAMELTNTDRGIIALTRLLDRDALLTEGVPIPGSGAPSDPVGPGAPAGPADATPETLPSDDDDPGGGPEQRETPAKTTQLQEVVR